MMDRGGNAKDIKAAMKPLQEYSIRDLLVPLAKAPIGDVEFLGLFALIWPELMHQMESGIMQRSIKCMVFGVRATGKGEPTFYYHAATYVAKLQRWFQHYSFLVCMAYVRFLARPRVLQSDLSAAMDTAAQHLDMTRQSNRVCGIPLKNRRKGVSNLPKVKAQEFPGITLVAMVLLGTRGKYLEETDTRNVQTAFSALYLLWMVLRRTWMDREEV